MWRIIVKPGLERCFKRENTSLIKLETSLQIRTDLFFNEVPILYIAMFIGLRNLKAML